MNNQNENKNNGDENIKNIIASQDSQKSHIHVIKPDYKHKSNGDGDDLKKAIIFLLGKELKDYSFEKKKDFLAKKIPSDTLEKALEIYPIIEADSKARIEEYIQDYESKNSKKGFFDGLFDLGVFTTVIISTLGINYLIDLQRNKKNEIFYKESEKKLNEEMNKMTEIIKKEIGNELIHFAKRSEVEDKIKEKIALQNQNAGLNLNLGSKNMKENLNILKTDVSLQDQKLKDLSVKLDNTSLLLKQDILQDIKKTIENNNQSLLMKILEMQNDLIVKINNQFTTSNSNINASPSLKNTNNTDSCVELPNREFLNYNNVIKPNYNDSKINSNLKNNLEHTNLLENKIANINNTNKIANDNLIEIDYSENKLSKIENHCSSLNKYPKEVMNITGAQIPLKRDNNLSSNSMSYTNDTCIINNPIEIKSIFEQNKIFITNDELPISESKTECIKENELDFNRCLTNIIDTLDESKRNNFILQFKVNLHFNL